MLRKSLIAGVILFLFSATGSQRAISQTPSPAQNAQTTGDEELKKAQAEYYRAQTESLRHRSFFDSLTENPTGLITALAAFVAGFIALASLIVNSRVTVQNQKDTQFYEALKRFGDKDSPTLRASAAGVVSQMGKARMALLRRRPYFKTAADQLVTGLLLEEDSVALLSIYDAIKNISGIDTTWTVAKLRAANDKLHEDLEDHILRWAIGNDITIFTKFTDAHVQQLAAISEAAGFIVAEWVDEYEGLIPASKPVVLKNYESRFRFAKAMSQTTDPLQLQRAIVVTSTRLRFLNGLLMDVMTTLGPHFRRRSAEVDLSARINQKTGRFMGVLLQGLDTYERPLMNATLIQAHLQKASFFNSELKNLDFRFAHMEQVELGSARMNSVDLSHTDLRDAKAGFIQCEDVNLSEADLRGADLSFAEFKNVKLAGAKIDLRTDFNRANWWRCDFYSDRGSHSHSQKTDDYLIEELRRRFDFPERAELHESVRAYLRRVEEKKA